MSDNQGSGYFFRIDLAPDCLFLRCDIGEQRRRADELARQLAERDVMAREIHHRIKNNIASVASVLTLQRDTARNPEVADALAQAVSRVASMGVLYDVLLETRDFTDVPVRDYVGRLIDAIAELTHTGAHLVIDRHIDSFNVPARLAHCLGLALNEVLTNAMKYAFVGKDSGTISVRVERADGLIRLVVEDDGEGLPDGFAPAGRKGLGLTIVELLAQQFDGRVDITNRTGKRGVFALVELALPREEAYAAAQDGRQVP